jgi:hypothetical protein
MERPDLCKRGAPALTVVVVYTRRNGSTYSSGLARIKGNWMKIRLSKRTPDKLDLAMVIAHELAHTRGAKDEYQMRHSAKYGRVGSYKTIYAWANDLPLEVVEKKSKVKPVDAKLTHAQKMLKAAFTREKRATTLRKKWEAKVKYYTKRVDMPVVEPKPRKPREKKPQTIEAWLKSNGGFTCDRDGTSYQVFAPDGYRLSTGVHRFFADSVKEVKETTNGFQNDLVRCENDCDCKY